MDSGDGFEDFNVRIDPRLAAAIRRGVKMQRDCSAVRTWADRELMRAITQAVFTGKANLTYGHEVLCRRIKIDLPAEDIAAELRSIAGLMAEVLEDDDDYVIRIAWPTPIGMAEAETAAKLPPKVA